MSAKSVCLVTGCSSGFGRLISETLARRGHTVIAGMRDPSGKNAGPANELKRLGEKDGLAIRVAALDITNETSVESAVKDALSVSGRIDVLVNNAGIAAFGITEAFTVDQVKDLFDTNVFGALRMKRAILPSMRESHRGLIIDISTSIARVPMPFMGVYCASKAAEEMFAEEARHTLAPFGIESTLLEAAIYPTGMSQRMFQPADQARLGGYGPLFPVMEQMGKSMEYMLSSKPDPQEVADAVLALVEAPAGKRPMRTLVGSSHAPGIKEMNEASDRVIAGFYEMMGVGPMLRFRG